MQIGADVKPVFFFNLGEKKGGGQNPLIRSGK
jgi:hypothetical protein